MAPKPYLLLATLGSEAQVVTITLDLLNARGYNIRRLVVLHTGGEKSPTRESLPRLLNELETYPSYRRLEHQEVCFVDEQGAPLPDIITADQNRAVFRTIFETLRQIKREGWAVHFSAAGGRKAMAAYAMLSAQFLFDEGDHFWNLWSSLALLNDKRLHARSHEADLIRLPIPPWYIGLSEKERFIESLTPAERDIFKMLAKGYKDNQIARQRFTTERTVHTHVKTLREKVKTAFNLTDEGVRYALIREFGPYYDLMDALGYTDTAALPETTEKRLAGR